MKHLICVMLVFVSVAGYLQAEETPRVIELIGHTDVINFAAFSPDGKRIVTGSKDQTVRIWNAETGKELQKLEKYTSDDISPAIFSPDGKKIVTKDNFDAVRIWDAETGKMLHKLEENVIQGGFGILNFNPIVVFSPDSKKVFTAGNFDTAPKIRDTESGKVLLELKGYYGPLLSVIFSPDGKKMAMSGDATVIIWDVESGSANFGEKLLEIDLEGGSGYRSVAFSPDGKKIVTAGTTITAFGAGGGDKTVRIRDAKSGKILDELVGHTDDVSTAVFFPDGKKVVTVSLDNTARIWDAESGKELKKLEGDTNFAYSAIVSSDGKKVAIHTLGLGIQVWDVESGKKLQMLNILDRSYAISSDARKVLTVSRNRDGNSIAKIWDLGQLLPP